MLSTLKKTAMVPAKETLRKNKREYRRVYKNASLVATYGKDAIIVMAGYGIGVDTAARILRKQKKGDELLEEIIKAEITYSKTRQFWS
jgi:ATP-dependent Lhr-like helicase